MFRCLVLPSPCASMHSERPAYLLLVHPVCAKLECCSAVQCSAAVGACATRTVHITLRCCSAATTGIVAAVSPEGTVELKVTQPVYLNPGGATGADVKHGDPPGGSKGSLTQAQLSLLPWLKLCCCWCFGSIMQYIYMPDNPKMSSLCCYIFQKAETCDQLKFGTALAGRGGGRGARHR
jgi:hypothetical protein